MNQDRKTKIQKDKKTIHPNFNDKMISIDMNYKRLPRTERQIDKKAER